MGEGGKGPIGRVGERRTTRGTKNGGWEQKRGEMIVMSERAKLVYVENRHSFIVKLFRQIHACFVTY